MSNAFGRIEKSEYTMEACMFLVETCISIGYKFCFKPGYDFNKMKPYFTRTELISKTLFKTDDILLINLPIEYHETFKSLEISRELLKASMENIAKNHQLYYKSLIAGKPTYMEVQYFIDTLINLQKKAE